MLKETFEFVVSIIATQVNWHEPTFGRGVVAICPCSSCNWVDCRGGARLVCRGCRRSAVQQPDVKGAGGRGPSRIRSEHPRL